VRAISIKASKSRGKIEELAHTVLQLRQERNSLIAEIELVDAQKVEGLNLARLSEIYRK
jgi:hypothetical protein